MDLQKLLAATVRNKYLEKLHYSIAPFFNPVYDTLF